MTLEVVRFFQTVRLRNKKLLRTEIRDAAGNLTGHRIQATARTSALNEELGQVTHIFADKTGTLTKNQLLFRKLMIGERAFTDQAAEKAEDGSRHLDQALIDLLKVGEPESERALQALRCLALCHSVGFDENMMWDSSSPEELTFVNFAKNYGVIFQMPETSGTATYNILNEYGNDRRFQVLKRFEFDSARKRMSIVVENQNGEILLFTKGAEEVVKNLLKLSEPNDLNALDNQLIDESRQGHRTMLLAFKKVSTKQWAGFNERYAKVQTKPANKEELDELQNELEQGLSLLAGVSLEDKLQDQAQESVRFIRNAKINVWMVTGDRSEVAISVSRAAGLLTDDMEIFYFNDVSEVSQAGIAKVSNRLKTLPKSKNICGVVHGNFWAAFEGRKHTNFEIYRSFAEILLRFKAAIFYRVSSKQKAEIVNLVRDFGQSAVTLAIGDGANDMNMLSASHVGIAIKGPDGLQAAQAGDFVIAEFRHLVPLLFHFGRECYRKNSNVALFTFYKSSLLVMPQFWFGFFNFFAGMTLYDTYSYQLFNVLFCSAAIVVYGVFDKSYPKTKLLFSPTLYKTGPGHFYFNLLRFGLQIAKAFLLGLFIQLTALAFFDWGNYTNGFFYGFWTFGNMVLLGVVIITNLKVISMANSFSFLLVVSALVGIGFYFLVWFFISLNSNTDLYGTFLEVLRGEHVYIFAVIMLGVCVFEYLFEKLQYLLTETKYTPDFSAPVNGELQGPAFGTKAGEDFNASRSSSSQSSRFEENDKTHIADNLYEDPNLVQNEEEEILDESEYKINL